MMFVAHKWYTNMPDLKIKVSSNAAPFVLQSHKYWSATHWSAADFHKLLLGFLWQAGNNLSLPLFEKCQRGWGTWVRLGRGQTAGKAQADWGPCSTTLLPFLICPFQLQGESRGSERFSNFPKIIHAHGQEVRSTSYQSSALCNKPQNTIFREKRYLWGPTGISKAFHPHHFQPSPHEGLSFNHCFFFFFI